MIIIAGTLRVVQTSLVKPQPETTARLLNHVLSVAPRMLWLCCSSDSCIIIFAFRILLTWLPAVAVIPSSNVSQKDGLPSSPSQDQT